MCFSSLTRVVDRTAAVWSLQTMAGAPTGQAAHSAVQKSPPSVTHITGYYSFNRPRRDGRLSWPCWLTDSGRRTHKVVKHPSISLAQDKESPPARTDVLTTMLRHQLSLTIAELSTFKQVRFFWPTLYMVLLAYLECVFVLFCFSSSVYRMTWIIVVLVMIITVYR